MWKVLIKEFGSDNIVETIECTSERNAEKVERGANINLNHEDYYTEIVQDVQE